MAAETPEGDLAVKVLDEYMQDFQRRNPTLRVFCCYLHQDEATPHLHIDFVPYVTGWKGKGMDTRVSLKQALKSLGFQGGAKHDTELNQWINHEKEVLAEIMERYEIEWEQKGTHEEHLEVYNFKKKERAKEVKELEQKIENLTADVEATESDIKALNQEKADAEKARDQVRESKEQAEKEFKHMEKQRNQLQSIINNINKELKNSGQIKLVLPEAGALELASTYRNKKIKPLFAKIKNYVAAHVDPELDESYATLTKMNSLGWTDYNGNKPLNNPAYQAIRTIANEVLYSIAISASGLKNRKKQKGKEFEMRIVDNFGRRYKWSKTEITCSLETMELVFQDKVEKRTLYIDEYKNGSKVEYVGP